MKKIICFLFATTILHAGCKPNIKPDPEPVNLTGVTEANAPISVPAAGNSYAVPEQSVSIPSAAGGSFSLTNSGGTVNVYFRLGRAGEMNLGLVGSTPNNGQLNVTVALSGSTSRFYPVGKVDIATPGYVKVSLSSSGGGSVSVSGLRIGGTATAGTNNFCTEANLANPADSWAYWATRGPSVHMRYTTGANIEYFYNELTVPAGNDVVGSYFMTNGFGEGYCGFQVNSATERRILFSVWSPFQTDNPANIPPEARVVLVNRGPGVTIGQFGSEGSGGQSYLVYPWKADVTYKMLTQIRYFGPSTSTQYPYLNEYTAYFFDPDQNSWRLIARWRRPDTTQKTYTGAYSFLENLETWQGHVTRQGFYGNQWTYSTTGVWTEVTAANFTYDNTGRQGVRVDYDGGVTGNRFWLHNCGFFDVVRKAYNTPLTRTANGVSARPDIDFTALANLPTG